MKPTAQPQPDPRSRRFARVGEAEGWFSLAATAALFFLPGSPPLGDPFRTYLVISIFAAAALTAIGGVRFARGPGQGAAAVSLAYLSLLFLAFVVRGVLNWGQVMRFWGR